MPAAVSQTDTNMEMSWASLRIVGLQVYSSWFKQQAKICSLNLLDSLLCTNIIFTLLKSKPNISHSSWISEGFMDGKWSFHTRTLSSALDAHTWASELALDSWQLPDAGAGLQDVEVLEDVREGHQAQRSQEPQTNPGPGRSMWTV